jgi:hypothetical protein
VKMPKTASIYEPPPFTCSLPDALRLVVSCEFHLDTAALMPTVYRVISLICKGIDPARLRGDTHLSHRLSQ